ncbi:MAG TPA: VTT domain-containing protein [Dehalococcoidia bacterium]|nr:VTT domain-containing protein [Dehalococcoidia bacterium]
MKATPKPAAAPRSRPGLLGRIERLIAPLEQEEEGVEEVLEASANQRIAIVGIVLALVGMTAAIVIAYTVGGVKLVERLGYLGVFMSAVIGSASMFIPVPGALAGITLGLLLDPVPFVPLPQPIVIGVLVAAGSALGELTGYSTGVGGRSVIGNSRGGRMLVRLMRRHGTATLFCVAAVPNPFIDVGGIAAGVAGMSMRRFVSVMFVGKTINYIAVAYIVSSGIEGLQRIFA